MPKNSRSLLKAVSILMIFLGIPLAVWCIGLVNQATATYRYAGIGCFLAAILNALLPGAGIAGLVCASRDRTVPCRIIALIFLAICAVLTVLMLSFTVLTIPVTIVLLILYHKGAAGS
ncbi:MAG: hypothetical protein J5744_06840 [Oscillospiraceae bacterium]|nr:hypothetical protein [Oscillospiraceae bacterium]